MKTNKFGIVSSIISILAIICTFAFDFIKVTPFTHPLLQTKIGANVTAWNTFAGGDEVVARGIQEGSSTGIIILIAVILLAVNIIIQFLKPGKIAAMVNNSVSIATTAIYLLVGILVCSSEKLNTPIPQIPQLSFNPEMTPYAYITIAFCAAMFFVPKMVSKK